jgi:hypothetical protein
MEFLEHTIEVNVEVSFVVHIDSLQDGLNALRNSSFGEPEGHRPDRERPQAL